MNSRDNPFKPGSCPLSCRKVKAIIAIAVIVGCTTYGGYRWYCVQHTKKSVAAAQAYAKLLPELECNIERHKAEEPSLETTGSLEDRIASFLQQYGRTTYGTFLALQGAKYWVNQQDYTKAAQLLAAALPETGDRELQVIVRLRLANLYHQLQRYDEALSVLSPIKKNERSWRFTPQEKQKTQAWWLAVEALRGDILHSQHNTAAARAVYQQVLAQADSWLLQTRMRLQLDDMTDSQEGG